MKLKSSFFRLAFLALPLLVLAPARAAVNPAIVSADARWVIYADLNALRASTLGKEVVALAEKAQVETPGGKVGVDWQKLLATVGAATAYGTNLSPDPKQIDGALVIQGTADLRKIAESLLIQANLANPHDVAELTDLPFPAYGIKPAKAEQEALVIAFPPEPIVIVSKSHPQIVKARDVFRGAAPSLAKGPASPLTKFFAGANDAYLFAASIVPAENFFKEDGPQARILKMASAGSCVIGESGPNTFAHSELTASSDQMADKLMKILQGMTAMMSLAETNDKQLAEFLNSATVARHENTVTLDVAYSSTRLAEMVKNVQQQAQTRPAERAAAQLVNGRALAEWKAEAAAAPAADGPAPLATRSIDGVALKNGVILTLGRASNGGKNPRFDRIEITPADGSGATLTFRPEFMRTAGPRGNWAQLQFPGADGNYNLKVFYVNDPEGKATYAVSVREPKADTPPPAPRAPQAPAPEKK